MLFSHKARQHIGEFLNRLAQAAERERQRKEAECRATEVSAIRDQIKFSLPKTEPAPKSPMTPALVKPDARWREVVVPPAVILILGKRGSGKSALAYRLLELFRYRLTPFVVGAPPQAAKLLPDWNGTVPSFEDLPHNCIALVDDVYLHYHSRRSMAQESADMSQQLNLSRQRNQTLIFVSQEACQVDLNISSSTNVFLCSVVMPTVSPLIFWS